MPKSVSVTTLTDTCVTIFNTTIMAKFPILKLGFLTRGMRHALSGMRYAAKIATTYYSRYDSLHTVSVYGMR